ncbi:hypothetical protein Sme01_30090 [Sphaerisporangium melleum]|uniref:Uncharacterized protein n=1 Tax=Sphaerisporangium melleum TaxID=321316 RepID=A0A917R285_9ACTN|nr:hypothetical protein [Sphaerisporangium melleum]GGK85391.1 hypothetical protein GCM10007964_29870 [Sphaerisporangium melleum]GII70533.1 hypothetical protein Sme01_30090 [Sphaerisporangium melleum]
MLPPAEPEPSSPPAELASAESAQVRPLPASSEPVASAPVAPVPEPPGPIASVPAGLDPAVLELYKTAVEMADRVSARRGTANAFFLTAQTTFVAVVGLTVPDLARSPWVVSVAVAVAGILLSAAWWLQLRSYRLLNGAKFQVINEIERRLPVRPYTDEWALLAPRPTAGRRGRYAELGTAERLLPWMFALLHALLLTGTLPR